MQAPNPLERLRDDAVAAFGPAINANAPGLIGVLRGSVSYSVVERSSSQIIVDRRALLLALVAEGLGTRHQYANTATWFTGWLVSRLPTLNLPAICVRACTSDQSLNEAVGKGFTLVISESVRSALGQAAKFAIMTVDRDRISLRHLFLALLVQPNHQLEIKEFNWSATADDVAQLRALLLERIGSDPASGESVEAWQKLLGGAAASPASSATQMPHHGPRGLDSETADAAASPPPTPPTPAIPALLVSGFDADRTRGRDGDPLETDADVVAMARLICHEDADPPISIGVFGGWGSGKSTFMEALQEQVAKLAAAAADQDPAGDGPRFVAPIVQIRFNAWQFADANLWASLTAEFFDQLRAGGFEGGGRKIHATLIENVNEHVRGLSKEAAERRAAVARADEALRDAQVAHDQTVKKKDKNVRQAMISGFAEAYERNRGELTRFGLIDRNSGDQVAAFIDVAKDARTQWGRLKRIPRILLAQWPVLLMVALLVAGVGLAALLITGRDLAGALAGAVAAAAGLLPLIHRGLHVVRAVLRQVEPFADKIEEAEKAGLKTVLESEVVLRSAAGEADALRAVADRADRALARYIDPSAQSNPPRVLRYLLEDDPNTKALEQEIGLIGRARRLFQALDQIVGDNRRKNERLRALRSLSLAEHDEASVKEARGLIREVDKDIPDRIVLYVDDLDRCTHEQVYRVLQAVHLLLAFKLFVVVVAVDVAWVEAAVAKSIEFAGAESEDDAVKEASRRRRAVEYLSKIFQLPFWLKPFTGERDERYGKYIRSLTRTAPAPVTPSDVQVDEPVDREREETPPARADGPKKAGKRGGAAVEAPENAKAGTKQPAPAPPDPRAVASALKTLQLAPAEVDFLASDEISALAASDPRGVKRLVNVYKIARARLSETDDAMILGTEGRPPAYPLIALCAAIESGQPLETADRFYAALKQAAPGSQLRDIQGAPRIQAAVTAAVKARGDRPIAMAEAFAVARVVRRYSFNKYH